jgi:hypothetical protein
MPLQNRVQPNGEIIAISARGTFTGNRGIIHRADQTLGTSRWSHHAWICCTLDWQGRKRSVMSGRNWTELFFLDEAVALAAGHRPCGYCRRADYTGFVDAWETVSGTRPSAKDMDRTLHASRVTRKRAKITYRSPLNTLPSGAFIEICEQVYLWHNQRLHPYTANGYQAPIVANIETMVTVLTPHPIISVLSAGYAPQLHPSCLL